MTSSDLPTRTGQDCSMPQGNTVAISSQIDTVGTYSIRSGVRSAAILGQYLQFPDPCAQLGIVGVELFELVADLA